MRHFVWISFDLGVKSDHEGMYAWLDTKGAKECGDSLACFWFEHASNDVLEDMKKDLKSKWIVTTRCYLTVVLRSFIHRSRAREGGPPLGPAALWAFQQQKTILSYGSLQRRSTCLAVGATVGGPAITAP